MSLALLQNLLETLNILVQRLGMLHEAVHQPFAVPLSHLKFASVNFLKQFTVELVLNNLILRVFVESAQNLLFYRSR